MYKEAARILVTPEHIMFMVLVVQMLLDLYTARALEVLSYGTGGLVTKKHRQMSEPVRAPRAAHVTQSTLPMVRIIMITRATTHHHLRMN